VVVYGLLLAVLGMAWFEATLWPLNSWQLFSYTRGPSSSAVELLAFGPDGAEPVSPSDLWREYRVIDHAVDHAEGAAAKEALCLDLLERLVEQDPEVTSLTIDRVVSERPDGPATPPVERSRTNLARCDR
jgi:hypothetical protein